MKSVDSEFQSISQDQLNITNIVSGVHSRYACRPGSTGKISSKPDEGKQGGNLIKKDGRCNNGRPFMAKQPWEIFGEIAVADIGKGCIAIVSAVDVPIVEQHRWYPLYRGKIAYAFTGQGIAMHRLLLGLVKGDPQHVDHKDHDGLNNSRGNIRVATTSQNLANQRKRLNCTSQFKGVRLLEGKWEAAICRTINGKKTKLRIGRFSNEIAAALAYDAFALELSGEFACTNFPLPSIATHSAAA